MGDQETQPIRNTASHNDDAAPKPPEDKQPISLYDVAGGKTSIVPKHESHPEVQRMLTATLAGLSTLTLLGDDVAKKPRRRRADHIPTDTTGKAADAMKNQSNEKVNGTIVAVKNELNPNDPMHKHASQFSPMGILERNKHIEINSDGSWRTNPNNKLEKTDNWELQIWPHESLKEKPKVLLDSLTKIEAYYAAQHPSVTLPALPDKNDPQLKEKLAAYFPQLPEPRHPNKKDDDDDDDDDGKPDKPVTPSTPTTADSLTELNKMSQTLLGVPFTVVDPQTNQPKQVAYFMNPQTFTNFAGKVLAPNGSSRIYDILGSGQTADVMAVQLRLLQTGIAATATTAAIPGHPEDFTQLANNVSNLSRPLLSPSLNDQSDAAVLTQYFANALSNPEANKLFIGNLATALQNHSRGQLTVNDIKNFPAELQKAIVNATIAANAPGVNFATLDGTKRGQLVESLITVPYNFP